MDDWRHEWEIDPATLEIGPKVGEGEFGTVHKVRYIACGWWYTGQLCPSAHLTGIAVWCQHRCR